MLGYQESSREISGYGALLLLNRCVAFLRMGQHRGGNEMRAGGLFGNRSERASPCWLPLSSYLNETTELGLAHVKISGEFLVPILTVH